MGERDMNGNEIDLLPIDFLNSLGLEESRDLLRYIVAQADICDSRPLSVNTQVTQNIDYGRQFEKPQYQGLHDVEVREGESKVVGNFTGRNPIATLSFNLEGAYDGTERFMFDRIRFDIGLRDPREVREEDVGLARQVRKYTEMFFIGRSIAKR